MEVGFWYVDNIIKSYFSTLGPSSNDPSLDIAKKAVDLIVTCIEASYDAHRGSYICNNCYI